MPSLSRGSAVGCFLAVLCAALWLAPCLIGQQTAPAIVSPVVLAELTPLAPTMDCANLRFAEVGKQVGAATRIMSASVVSEGQPKPYCRVVGYVSPQVMFELHLPVKGWTQRYLQTGCGGLCGNLNVRVGNEEGCAPAEAGELAVASSNMGHQSAGDGAWGAVDPQLRIDFAYRGMHVTALAAKALIEKFYGQRPKYSYFAGCSDGGREALVEAQRYPDDFNGITAGAPALNFITQNTFFHGWNARVNTGADGRAILTAAQLPIFHTAVLAACDAADGVKDGLISDPRLCRFDPAVTQCKPGQDTSTCLSAEQVNVVREIYRGAHTAEGKQLVIGGPMPGSEMAWRGVYVPDSPEQPIMSGNMAGEALLNLAYWNRPAELRSLQDLRFDAATLDSLKPMHAIYDATDPDLSRFAAAGGKLILWHGWSDPHISPLNTIAYYDAVNRQMGPERTQSFVRLYLFPGGYHCAGGEGPFNVGLLQAIMAWVERGRAPYRLVASRFSTPDIGEAPPREVSASDNPAPDRSLPGLESSALVDRTRPVFPYPLVARYAGTGSIDDEANFVAEAPATASKDNFDWLGASFFSPGYEQWCSWKGMSFVCSGSDSQAK